MSETIPIAPDTPLPCLLHGFWRPMRLIPIWTDETPPKRYTYPMPRPHGAVPNNVYHASYHIPSKKTPMILPKRSNTASITQVYSESFLLYLPIPFAVPYGFIMTDEPDHSPSHMQLMGQSRIYRISCQICWQLPLTAIFFCCCSL